MIRIYGYYSCGGYKDMYLGNSEENKIATYFLPLLPVLKRKNRPEDAEKISGLESLPKIELIHHDNRRGFPEEANIMFSHGGYLNIYRTLKNGEACLAIRDLESATKDEEGRATPFNLLLVADSQPSIKTLDSVALYCANHNEDSKVILSSLFSYDPEANGIKFNLQEILKWMGGIDTTIEFNHYPDIIHYIIIASESQIQISINEQNLSQQKIERFLNTKGEIISGFLPIITHRNTQQRIESSSNDTSPDKDGYSIELQQTAKLTNPENKLPTPLTTTVCKETNQEPVVIEQPIPNATIEEIFKQINSMKEQFTMLELLHDDNKTISQLVNRYSSELEYLKKTLNPTITSPHSDKPWKDWIIRNKKQLSLICLGLIIGFLFATAIFHI